MGVVVRDSKGEAGPFAFPRGKKNKGWGVIRRPSAHDGDIVRWSKQYHFEHAHEAPALGLSKPSRL